MAKECTPRVVPGRWVGDHEIVLSRAMVFQMGGKLIRVPAGFHTDLASTPKKLHMLVLLVGFLLCGLWVPQEWHVLTFGFTLFLAEGVRQAVPPSAGLHAPAAIEHDYLYATGLLPKTQADKRFYKHMIALGVRPSRAGLMYLCVASFGWWAWWGHRARQRREKLTQSRREAEG